MKLAAGRTQFPEEGRDVRQDFPPDGFPNRRPNLGME